MTTGQRFCLAVALIFLTAAGIDHAAGMKTAYTVEFTLAFWALALFVFWGVEWRK